MAATKQTSKAVEPIVGWILVTREELSGGELGGWYIAWLEPFSTKKQALEFAQNHHWPKPYRAMRGQLAVKP